MLTKFVHEISSQWKTEQLQIIKHFQIDLEGQDPFFIPGQEELKQLKKEEQIAK